MTEHEQKKYDGRASSGETKGPGEHTYHYDREERLKGLSFEYPRGKSKGVFRRNKGLTFILLDIFILLIIGFVLVPLMRGRFGTDTWKGYQLELEATSFDDTVYAQLIVTDGGNGEFPGEMIDITFVYGDQIIGESFTDFFPEAGGTETSVRTSYPSDGTSTSIMVRIIHAGETFTMTGRIR